jgi:poly(hydroxyalkanoate) depolymerase family esterase
MRLDFGQAMRAATGLTRTQQLAEATRVIQEALSGESAATVAPAPPRNGRPDPLPRENPSNAAPDKTPPDAERNLFFGKLGRRPKWSLGDVVKTLRRTELPASMPLPSRKPARGAPAIPAGAQFLSRSFTAPAGSRAYRLYVPADRETSGLPLIIMLHGCTQNPDDFATGTRMNALAEEVGFLVAYPGQPATANPGSCWNWFERKDQIRGRGEPSIIAGIGEEIVAEYDLDRRRVFVAGLSAGGAMAAVMGATYPDLFSAIGVHSGLAHGSASDAMSAFAAMRGEIVSRPQPGNPAHATPRVIVFHGDADRTVHPANGERIVESSAVAPGTSTTTETGKAGGRSFSRTIIRETNGASRAEHWLIAGAGHAWSGGSPEGSYADAAGPDASREMVRFFLEP